MRLRFLSLVLAWTLGVATIQAGEYRYPAGTPVLCLTLPDDWSTVEKTGPSLMLLCSPPDDTTYTISLLTLPTVGDAADLGQLLTKITRAGAEGSGMTEIVVSLPSQESVTGSSRVFTKVTTSGKHDSENSAYTYYAFRLPTTGKTYAIGAAGLQAMIDAHRAEFEAVARSIAPVN